MQTYLPFIKEMLSEWYLFTLNNPLYAAALATAVWLLTSTLYSIRIAAIKRGKAAGEKAAIESLNAMQQQLQQSQEALAETVEQTEKAQRAAQDETQRALTVEQLIYQRNQQIAGIIQTLATSFDLGERPLLASEDVKADSLWQQHDKVINQLIERLRTEVQAKIESQQTCQAATTKLAEKETLLNALQSTLDNHTNQLSKLEQALEEQKSMLQQQNNSQEALSDTLKNFQPTITQPIAPLPETVPAVQNLQQPMQAAESPTFEVPSVAQPEPTIPVEQIIAVPEVAVIPQVEETPIDPFTFIEEAEPLDLVLDENLQPVLKQTTSASSNMEQQAVTSAKGSIGKIKNLFGKKQQPVKTEPQWTDENPAEKETQPLPSYVEQQPENEEPEQAQNKPGKLTGFYSKFISKDK